MKNSGMILKAFSWKRGRRRGFLSSTPAAVFSRSRVLIGILLAAFGFSSWYFRNSSSTELQSGIFLFRAPGISGEYRRNTHPSLHTPSTSENVDRHIVFKSSRNEVVASSSIGSADDANVGIDNIDARQVPMRRMSPLACTAYDDRPSQFPSNFWYVKSHKTASSTLAGVFRSVAAHRGVTMLNAEEVRMDVEQLKSAKQKVISAMNSVFGEVPRLGLANHMPLNTESYALLKSDGPLLLFTSVREPVGYFHSIFLHKCRNSEMKKNVDCYGAVVDKKFAMATTMEPNPQLNYIRGDAVDVESAAAQYGLIFVRERLEESLVVFMILYGLDFADIVHLSSKVRTDMYPDSERMPVELNELVERKSREDARLYARANALLDDKIATINKNCKGEAYFASMLAVFSRLQATVVDECEGYNRWYEEHGFSTVLTYWNDNGVAPRCRDFVVRREMRAWQEEDKAIAIRVAVAEALAAESARSSSEGSGASELDGWGMPKKLLQKVT